MSQRYHSSRKEHVPLTLGELCAKVTNLYLLFRDRDYFKGKAGITRNELPDAIKQEAALALPFQPFPITKWQDGDLTDDQIFDTVEFLYDYVSKPEGWAGMVTETGWNYDDYASYDGEAGQREFREKANAFLCDYCTGFELTAQGTILALGTHGLQQILEAEIMPYDEANVDNRVRNAILKWRNRHLDLSEKKQAIRELADVFEWLKKTKRLERVLERKDEAAIFDIANNFAIRHHNPQQKTNYDPTIWYPWIFHFYLATYHAVIRLLEKENK